MEHFAFGEGLGACIGPASAQPDLLAESGYHYTLKWCHDDQLTAMHTRSGKKLWSIPYP
jgi:allantoinase